MALPLMTDRAARLPVSPICLGAVDTPDAILLAELDTGGGELVEAA